MRILTGFLLLLILFRSTPFFKDHDFAIIRNKRTGERIAVDPNVYDYLIIREITLR